MASGFIRSIRGGGGLILLAGLNVLAFQLSSAQSVGDVRVDANGNVINVKPTNFPTGKLKVNGQDISSGILPTLADSSASNASIYRSTTQGSPAILSYKDSAGVVHQIALDPSQFALADGLTTLAESFAGLTLDSIAGKITDSQLPDDLSITNPGYNFFWFFDQSANGGSGGTVARRYVQGGDLGGVQAVTLSGNQNNWLPTNLSTVFTIYVDGGASDRTITGLCADLGACTTAGKEGLLRRIVNKGSTNNLIFPNEDSGSSAVNRLTVANAIALPPNRELTLVYDATATRWRPWSDALTDSGVTSGTYGSATKSVTVAVSRAGRVTSISENDISGGGTGGGGGYTRAGPNFTSSGPAVGKIGGYWVCSYAGTISAWNLTLDTGTATVKFWKIGTGTTKPTSTNSINTSGIAISTGTNLRSTTLTDFSTTTVSKGDIFAAEITALTGSPTELSGGLEITPNGNTRSISFTASSPLVSKIAGYRTAPYTGTISAYNITSDAGTCTIKVWKIAAGTAKPTSTNSINTSGVSLSTGTNVHSTTLTDFTTTIVTAGDILAFEITAVSGATEISGSLEVTPQ